MGPPINNFKVEQYSDKFIRTLYSKDFHNYHIKHFRKKNINMGKTILDLYNFDSVVDFGCSIGSFLEPFLEKNKIIKGYEYCYTESLEGIRKIDGLENFIEFGDVTKDIKVDRKYDCVVTIEVAEHIPTEFSEQLVINLVNASKNFILFTATLPGQGGTGHINCQPKEFWIKIFEKYDYKRDINEEQKVRNYCKPSNKSDGTEEDFPYVWQHVYNNLMIFYQR